MSSQPSVTAILLAGRRPGIDPLAAHFGSADKALIEVVGEPMLSRVARVLVEHPAIARVLVVAQEPARLMTHPGTCWMAAHPAVGVEAVGQSVSLAVAEVLERHPKGFPFLVTTADNVLLDRTILDAFMGPAARTGADIAVGMVERRVMMRAYPDARRTWLRFRGGAWSGANLFWLGSPAVDRALAHWSTIEQQRKRGRAIISAFGPLLLAGVALRLLSLPQALRRAGLRLGVSAALVPLPVAEACIDVDKPEDHALASAIVARRVGTGIAADA